MSKPSSKVKQGRINTDKMNLKFSAVFMAMLRNLGNLMRLTQTEMIHQVVMVAALNQIERAEAMGILEPGEKIRVLEEYQNLDDNQPVVWEGFYAAYGRLLNRIHARCPAFAAMLTKQATEQMAARVEASKCETDRTGE